MMEPVYKIFITLFVLKMLGFFKHENNVVIFHVNGSYTC